MRQRFGRFAARIEGWRLTEGEVFGKTRRRVTLEATREQGEQGPAGRIGAARSARKPSRDGRAPKCLAERRAVGRLGVKEDGHPIEGDSTFGYAQDSPRDLGGFPRFSWCGEDRHRVIRLGGRALGVGEQVTVESTEGPRRFADRA